MDNDHHEEQEDHSVGLDHQLMTALLASAGDFGNIGKPAASIMEIQNLDEYQVDESFKKRRKEKGEDSCAICSDEYKIDEYVKQMPCKHFFHTECLHEWLEKHGNSCPLCRKALGTLDYKYDEQQRLASKKKDNDDDRYSFRNSSSAAQHMYM